MRVNRHDLKLHRGEPYTELLTYREGGRVTLVDFSRLQINARLTVKDSQRAIPVTAVGVSLGKIRLHISDDQIAALPADQAEFDLFAAETLQTAPKLVFCGYVTITDKETSQ